MLDAVGSHPFIWTSGGKEWMVEGLTPDMITDSDIIYGLARECRFARQIRPDLFYSVAQHSVYVRSCLPKELGLYALLHDAAEAYLGDVAKPIKMLLPDYTQFEDRVMKVIAEKYGLMWPFPPAVKEYDCRIVLDEALRLFDEPPVWVQDHIDAGVEPIGLTIEPWTWKQAARYFECAFRQDLYNHKRRQA